MRAPGPGATWVVLCVIVAASTACRSAPGRPPDKPAATPAPAWAIVSPEQIREAERRGIPVAHEEPRAGVRFVLVPGNDRVASFYLTTTETTNAAYRRFRPDHRSTFNADDQPVDVVTYRQAEAFADWLSTSESSPRYRLPTEEEWRHACLAGAETGFAWGAELHADQANVSTRDPLASGPLNRTTPVGSYPPNRWGLFDMHGNLWEWCSSPGAVHGSVEVGVTRGGSWRHAPREARAEVRYEHSVEHWDPDIGFRLARSVE